ncbi:MAG: helix-turn-helix transcriptional regulator [Clostridia bacterium]|nr:helix-turn-helix transcriptional regulator [Clostridia bacterium]
MADTVYKAIRKKHGLTREEVCDAAQAKNGCLQPERLERIENGKFPITPDEVLLLSAVYGEPAMCNQYCAKECPIGARYVPEVKVKDLSQIVLEMLSSLNAMRKKQERLIEITADGRIDDAEIHDFVFIQSELERISLTVEALQLWVEQMLASNRINMEQYLKIKNGN